MSKDSILLGVLFVFVMAALPACAEEVQEEPAVQLPPREHTWVRKETVKKTTGVFSFDQEESRAQISVNEALAKKLTAGNSANSKGSVKDSATCLAVLKPMDDKRMAVQKTGGMWSAFERSSDIRSYSENGMQIDSRINKLIFALRHLCKTAKGLPQNNIARVISGKVSQKGKEAVAREFMDLGKAEEDIDIWLEYAEYWQKNQKRDLDYSSIEGLMAQTMPLIDYYAKLTQRPVDASNKAGYLSDAVTLLETIKKLSSTDEYITLALKEEKDAPYENLDPDM
ncbi:hypothetical protein MNBD_NITROSPINAE05-55 [hydrothermal vent metagenome]|uniref:Uncharacterized protein n=1 Tax=hydrothermal vent metagenome TaxID=652676 RepID=A0A3B1D1E4_9ZZZZ